MTSLIYISYDGICEALGQSQIIPYLKRLSDKYRIHIISYEKPNDYKNKKRIFSLRANLKDFDIEWTPMLYHKSPSVLATIFDILKGQFITMRIARRLKAEILHVRSYIPALIALPTKRLTGVKLLFDIRGFWADERVDGGIWQRNSIIYRIVKRLERYLFIEADHVVTLTESSVSEIKSFNYWKNISPKITVIPTCADLEKFIPPKKTPDFDKFIFGYVGSFGTWYMLEETIALFSAILELRPEARMIVINRNEHELVKTSFIRAGIPIERIEITKCSYNEVSYHIQRMHAASVLIRPCFSKIASAPTKLAEYLGCSVPCVGTHEVGDMEKVLEGDGIGVILRNFDLKAIREAAIKIVTLAESSDVRARCRDIAVSRFSLNKGVEAYRLIYSNLINSQDKRKLIS